MTIFNFSDYRSFLKYYIKGLPKSGRGQVNKIASFLGVNSTLVSQVLGARKNFTLEQGQILTEFLGLDSLAADYFLLLLQFEKAGTKKLKDYFKRKITQTLDSSLDIKNRVVVDRALTDQERAIFYSSWLYSAIRLYCSLDDGKTIDEVCERFSIERIKSLEILQFLVNAHLCTNEGGIYKLSSQKTHLEQGSLFLLRHYSNWRIKAIQRSENLGKKELMFTAPFSISFSDFEKIREEFLSIIQKLYATVGETTPQNIACVNIDLFWVK